MFQTDLKKLDYFEKCSYIEKVNNVVPILSEKFREIRKLLSERFDNLLQLKN